MQHQIQLAEIQSFYRALRGEPDAAAELTGSERYPAIRGTAVFYQTTAGVLVTVWAAGLPQGENDCSAPIFALHIHSGEACEGDRKDPFRAAMSHYNPGDCPHPDHAGDLAPLFGNQGQAFSVLLTDRFSVEEVIGRAVILHRDPDDFTTQPAGNAGEKIACGLSREIRRCGSSPCFAI